MSEPQVPASALTRGRFAPSPTGPLHLGSLTAALGSWLMARKFRGEWLLRVEDLDPPREKPGAAQQQLETLAAFGFLPDGPVLFQSQRGDFYAAALATLAANGDAFECLCTRSDLAGNGGVHRGCVAKPHGRRPAWRLRVPEGPVEFLDGIRGPQSQDLLASRSCRRLRALGRRALIRVLGSLAGRLPRALEWTTPSDLSRRPWRRWAKLATSSRRAVWGGCSVA